MVVAKKPKVPSQKRIQEREVTKAVKHYLELRGWRPMRCQRTVVGGAFQSGEPGQPDFMFLKYDTEPLHSPGNAKVIFIEFKSPSGHLGPKQEEWIARERQRGAVVLVVDNAEEFVKYYERAFGVAGQMRLG